MNVPAFVIPVVAATTSPFLNISATMNLKSGLD